jgi:uncharacterized membrane protein
MILQRSSDVRPEFLSRARRIPLRHNATSAFPACAAMLVAGWSGVAMAQVNCETIRAGPDRTDCYIGVSRINREKSAIGRRSSCAGLTRASISLAKILRNA